MLINKVIVQVIKDNKQRQNLFKKYQTLITYLNGFLFTQQVFNLISLKLQHTT